MGEGPQSFGGSRFEPGSRERRKGPTLLVILKKLGSLLHPQSMGRSNCAMALCMDGKFEVVEQNSLPFMMESTPV